MCSRKMSWLWAYLILDETGCAELDAVEADEDPALAAGPMVVEDGRLTNVAHFSYTFHRPLPNNNLSVAVLHAIFTPHFTVHTKALLLLLQHVTKLVTDQAKNELGLVDIVVCHWKRVTGH